MQRYRRLIITSIVVLVLFLGLQAVQAGINSGFRAYLNKTYPNNKFVLAKPIVRLFPLRYELSVHDMQDKVDFLAKSTYRLRKPAVKHDAQATSDGQNSDLWEPDSQYSDNYKEQKAAKAVNDQAGKLLQHEFHPYVSRYSIQVFYPGKHEKEVRPEARLLIRFNGKIKSREDMSKAISDCTAKIKQLNIPELQAIYFESSVLPLKVDKLAQLGIPAATFVKTEAVKDNNKTGKSNKGKKIQDVKATKVIASGYAHDKFMYCFNYDFSFGELKDELIINGLRVEELYGEVLERFYRPWNFNYNA